MKYLIILFLSINAYSADRYINRACVKYSIDCAIFKAILKHESRLQVSATNGLDHGIGQINHKTAKAYGMDLARLRSDVAYSVDQSAKVLAWFQKNYGAKEPDTWYCRYNVGTRKLEGNLMQLCKIYIRKVQSEL